jgi:hypothetical protein
VTGSVVVLRKWPIQCDKPDWAGRDRRSAQGPQRLQNGKERGGNCVGEEINSNRIIYPWAVLHTLRLTQE